MTNKISNGHFAVEIQDLRFGYDAQAVLTLPRYTLEAGSSAAVLGPSGS